MKRTTKILIAIASISAMQMVTASAQEEILIRALVDGPSELIVTTNGVQWKNGANAKPGRHNGQNEPTYINEQTWYPQWTLSEERGPDSSDVFPYPISSLDLDFELLAIGNDTDVKEIEPRTPPVVSYGVDSIIINISDPEAGSKWYAFALVGAYE